MLFYRYFALFSLQKHFIAEMTYHVSVVNLSDVLEHWNRNKYACKYNPRLSSFSEKDAITYFRRTTWSSLHMVVGSCFTLYCLSLMPENLLCFCILFYFILNALLKLEPVHVSKQ